MNLHISGLERLIKKLERIRSDIRPELIQATREATLYAQSKIPHYPPPPPQTTYRRTGKLGQSITGEVRELSTEIVGVIGTAIVYAPWVISNTQVGARGPQAWMHRGRWWTLQGVIEKEKRGIIVIYRRRLSELLRREGR